MIVGRSSPRARSWSVVSRAPEHTPPRIRALALHPARRIPRTMQHRHCTSFFVLCECVCRGCVQTTTHPLLFPPTPHAPSGAPSQFQPEALALALALGVRIYSDPGSR